MKTLRVWHLLHPFRVSHSQAGAWEREEKQSK
jgi:hypothetical protein